MRWSALQIGSAKETATGRRTVLLLIVVMLTLPGPAGAAVQTRVTICVPSFRGGPCFKPPENAGYEGEGGPSYLYGERVMVKGRVHTEEGGRVEIHRRKAPEYELRRIMPDFPVPLWERVATIPLNDVGRYRYVWRTTRADADQGTPYQVRAVYLAAPDHGMSRIQEVYILFGE